MTANRAMQTLFDQIAPDYDQHAPWFSTFGRALMSWCSPASGSSVLDIAAGRGAITGPAAEAVGPTGRVLAVDISPGMLSHLRSDLGYLPPLESRVMDMHDLDLPDASFDMVTCGFALHFVAEPRRAIGEIFRVLRPGGLLAFSGPDTGGLPDDAPHRIDGSETESFTPGSPSWDFVGELYADMAARSESVSNSELFIPPAKPLPDVCREIGFVDLEHRRVLASFAMRDPQHHWDWSMSHGLRGYVQELGPELGAEFRDRMMAGTQRIHDDRGIVMESTVAFVRARRPH